MTKKNMTKEELEKWYADFRKKQQEWSKRYRVRQQLLAKKAKAQKIVVTKAEIDEAMNE